LGTTTSPANSLFNTLYSELHGMARRELARRGRPSSLGVTTLLHEAYLNMSGRRGPCFPDRGRFMSYAARVMRGIIIDHARTCGTFKRGAAFEISPLEHDPFENPADARQLSLISDALDQLEKVEPGLAEVVDLKFFCGFSFAEIGALQNLSERSVQRKWEKARLYLYCSLRPDLAN
jgi:RNA polymerase sigma factor (TIGR02999 family)